MNRKNLIVTCGALALLMFAPTNKNMPVDNPFVITAQAAETYSDNWKIDSNQTWWYYMDDGSLAKNCWIADHGQWYLLDESGAMRTGIVKSNGGKYYLLDTVRGTGYYGRMLQNGEVYQGITIKADTASGSEGALSQETLNDLARAGIGHDNVINVENTKHVENGKVVYGGDATPAPEVKTEQPAGSTGTGSIFDQFDDYKVNQNGGGAANLGSGNLHGATDDQLKSIADGLRGA